MISGWSPIDAFHSHALAESWNALMGYSGRPLPLVGSSASVVFEVSQPPNGEAAALLVSAETGLRAIAVLERFPFAALFGVDLDVKDIPELPSSLRDALYDGVLALLWEAVPDNGLGALAIERVAACRNLTQEFGAAELRWFRLGFEGLAPERIEVAVGCLMAPLHQALLRGAIAPAAIDNGLKTRITADAFFTLGRLPLSMAQFERLVIGDLVVLRAVAQDCVDLRVDRWTYTAKRGERGWTIVSARPVDLARTRDNGKETNVSQDIEQSPDISQLTVTVDFDIGSVSKPLAEIQTWRPGTVVAVAPPIVGDGVEVALRVNGAIIGFGSLVKIDERLAVRIERWSNPRGAKTLDSASKKTKFPVGPDESRR